MAVTRYLQSLQPAQCPAGPRLHQLLVLVGHSDVSHRDAAQVQCRSVRYYQDVSPCLGLRPWATNYWRLGSINCHVSNSVVNVNHTYTSNYDDCRVGGLIGYCDHFRTKSTFLSRKTIMTNCSFSGKIYATGDGGGNDLTVGGLFGYQIYLLFRSRRYSGIALVRRYEELCQPYEYYGKSWSNYIYCCSFRIELRISYSFSVCESWNHQGWL